MTPAPYFRGRSACNGFLRFTSGSTYSEFLVANMAAKPLLIHILTSVVVAVAQTTITNPNAVAGWKYFHRCLSFCPQGWICMLPSPFSGGYWLVPCPFRGWYTRGGVYQVRGVPGKGYTMDYTSRGQVYKGGGYDMYRWPPELVAHILLECFLVNFVHWHEIPPKRYLPKQVSRLAYGQRCRLQCNS